MTKKIRLELDTVEEFIGATRDEDWRVRKAALKEMCPCHVKKEIPELWNRILEMYEDENAMVRDQVVHSLCDGSPASMELQVVETLEKMWCDKDERVRKKVRRALNSYRRNGKWNVL